MNRKIITRVLAILLVVAIALGGLWYANRVLVMKRVDGVLTMQNFYAQPDGTVDVLLVGNSHSGINIDTTTLWTEYGISAYDLWGGVQPLWNSYHFIVEALKYQTPKLVVLEVTAAISDYEYSEEQNQIKNTAGMKLSANKLEAVKVSAPKDRWLNLFLGFPLYHGRFDELTEKDFSQFPWSAGLENFKGSYLLYGTGNYELESAAGVTARRDIMDKELEYLNKIITLCRERGIPLMLLKTPALERRDAQPIYNTVSDIASINGLNFVNMNLMDDETGVTAADWSLDRHMNGSGARKVAHWLGAFLQSEYGIADHRGDARYASWDINAHTVNDDYLAAITDNADYFAELRRGGRAALVIKQSPWTENDAYSALAAELESVGFTGLKSAKDNDAFLVSDTASGADVPASVSGDAVTFTLDGEELTVSFEYQDAVLGGKRLSWFGSSEMTLIVYDTTTHELVDVVTFSSLNGYKLRRAESSD